ncbi:MAG: hypothetical protein DWQ58_09695 [Microcystis aeruginosa TA09]|jgi:hypothetical protein|uniref:hypothetical protein n=1 Tax=Microcystis sp. TaxID=1127 RepID=UPI000E375DBD|nr:MAG: hypothetical protein DWQ58_09695 [Microcystis aeruginosa TA09]
MFFDLCFFLFEISVSSDTFHFKIAIVEKLSIISYQLSDVSFQFTDYCLLDGYAVPLATLKKASH